MTRLFGAITLQFDGAKVEGGRLGPRDPRQQELRAPHVPRGRPCSTGAASPVVDRKRLSARCAGRAAHRVALHFGA